MDEHDATEVAYKNGYEKGKQDAVRWIPVTERLPEVSENVLVSRCGKIKIDRCDENGWFSFDFQGKRATHWMPLPEPPKEE